jgi:hypothetical protein
MVSKLWRRRLGLYGRGGEERHARNFIARQVGRARLRSCVEVPPPPPPAQPGRDPPGFVTPPGRSTAIGGPTGQLRSSGSTHGRTTCMRLASGSVSSECASGGSRPRGPHSDLGRMVITAHTEFLPSFLFFSIFFFLSFLPLDSRFEFKVWWRICTKF